MVPPLPVRRGAAGALSATVSATLLLSAGAAAADPGAVSVQVWGNALLVTAPASARELPAGLGEVPMTLDLEQTPLTDVAELLRRATGLDVVLGPDVLQDPPLLTMQVRGMRAGAVLRWIEATTGVQAVFTSGALYLSRTQPAAEAETRLYDVTDLVTGVRDFPGPRIGLDATRPGGMTLFPPESAPEARPALTTEDLAELIRRQAAAR
ncbi:MAG: hypothetical protein RLZZ127_1725 [Planctomycetota bacterium]